MGEVGDTRSDGDEGSEVLKTCRDGEEGASEGGDVERVNSAESIVLISPHIGFAR